MNAGPLQPGDGYDDEALPRPTFQISQPTPMEDPLEDHLEGNSPVDTPLDKTITGLNPAGREKVIRVARQHALPDDDLLFQVAEIIRKHDQGYTDAANKLLAYAEKIETAIADGPEQIRRAYDVLTTSAKHLEDNDAKTKEILKDVEAPQKWTKKVLYACGGLLAFSFFISVASIGTVVKSRGAVDALNAQRVESAENNRLSLRVIKLAWARMLLDGGRSTIKREYLDLSQKESQGRLTEADLKYRDNLRAAWGKLDIDEETLREDESALKYELGQR